MLQLASPSPPRRRTVGCTWRWCRRTTRRTRLPRSTLARTSSRPKSRRTTTKPSSSAGGRETTMTVHATTSSVSIAVIDSDLDCRQRLNAALAKLGPIAFTSLDAFQTDGAKAPTVVVLGPSFAAGAGLADAERFMQSRRDVAMVLVVNHLSTETLQQALRAGIRDVVPQDSDQLEEAINRVAGTLDVHSGGGSSPESGPANECRIITVFSTKGGSGKSV